MTRDTDLIRRALLNIREISMTLADEYGNPWVDSHMIEREVAAALAALSAPAQEPPSPGVTAGAIGATDLGPLAKAARGMKRIVEDIDGAINHGTWRDENGVRLKDTPEWVALYNALTDNNSATPAPVVPAEGPISTLEMVYRNMPDIPELPEAYQPRNIARSLAALRSAPPAEGLDALAEAAISRAIARLQALPISAGRPAWDQIVADEMRAALRSAPPVGARVIAEKAYLAGFNAAGEGYNGEWPFHDKGISPDTDEGWLIGRDMALAALLPAGEGEE